MFFLGHDDIHAMVVRGRREDVNAVDMVIVRCAPRSRSGKWSHQPGKASAILEKTIKAFIASEEGVE